MVVREVLGKAVNRLPYSGYFPSIITGAKDATPVNKEVERNVTAEHSPRDTIHNRILSKRAERLSKDVLAVDDMELNCLNYCDTFDDCVIESSPINRLKDNKLVNRVYDASETSDTMVPSSAALNKSYSTGGRYGGTALDMVEESREYDDVTSSRVERYLDEQNLKFDELVDKNLDVVLQDTSGDLKQNVIDLFNIYNHSVNDKITDISNIVGIMCNKTLSYTPFKRNVPLEPSQPSALALPLNELFNDADSDVDAILRSIDDRTTVEFLLDTLDQDTKADLFNQLKQELYNDERGNSNEDVLNDAMKEYNSSDLLIDKLQVCIIISVKLLFTGIKLTIPLSKVLYNRFINNQLYLVNNRNIKKVLSWITRLMQALESQLNNDRLASLQYGYEKDKTAAANSELHELCDEVALGTNNFLSQQFSTNKMDNTWKRAMMEYMFTKYISSSSPKKTDPKYSKFYSHPSASPSSSSSARSYRSSSPSGITRNPNSSSGPNDRVSMFKVAEQFVDEF